MATRVEQGDGAPPAGTAEGLFVGETGDDDAAPVVPAAAAGGMMALRDRFSMAVPGPATATADRDLAVRLLLDVARVTGLEKPRGCGRGGRWGR